jgi:CheY-like chemotaxis protein
MAINNTEPEMVTHRSTLKVLIIDDEPMIRQVVSRMLREKGYETEVTDDAEKTIEMVESHEYDVILVDVRMPGMNGYEFYNHIRQRKNQLTDRIIFVTGDVMNAVTTEFIEDNNIPFLAKPFSRDQLTDAINYVTQRCHQTTKIKVSTTDQEINFSEQYAK